MYCTWAPIYYLPHVVHAYNFWLFNAGEARSYLFYFVMHLSHAFLFLLFTARGQAFNFSLFTARKARIFRFNIYCMWGTHFSFYYVLHVRHAFTFLIFTALYVRQALMFLLLTAREARIFHFNIHCTRGTYLCLYSLLHVGKHLSL
jgi:hypothetical protein